MNIEIPLKDQITHVSKDGQTITGHLKSYRGCKVCYPPKKFKNYLQEQLKDPEFKKEYDKIIMPKRTIMASPNPMQTLKQKIRKALTCDKGCPHKLDPDICFEHQVARVEEIINSNIKVPSNWRYGQFLFNFLEWLKLVKGYASTQTPRMADTFYIPDKELMKLYEEFLEEHS